jgi:hypothetical protein
VGHGLRDTRGVLEETAKTRTLVASGTVDSTNVRSAPRGTVCLQVHDGMDTPGGVEVAVGTVDGIVVPALCTSGGTAVIGNAGGHVETVAAETVDGTVEREHGSYKRKVVELRT